MSGPVLTASMVGEVIPHVVPQLQQLWAMLRDQVTPLNSIIAIDGIVYGCLDEDALDWLANQFS